MGGLVQIVGARTGTAPVCLLDVITIDGNSYHWANAPINATPVYTGNVPPWAALQANPPVDWDTYYYPWLLTVDNFHLYRSMQSDTAEFLVQNISGNSLQRDIAGFLRASSFEGALFAFRVYYPQAQKTSFEMHGRLTVVAVSETTCQFGTTPLFDSNSYDGNPYEYSETCQWNYAEPGCGDTTNNPCSNSYPTCRQTKRFFGVLNTFQTNLAPTIASISTMSVQRRRMV
jgi:hypothetical protein